MERFSIGEHTLGQIRAWVEARTEESKLGWQNVFSDLETVRQYGQLFFSHLHDLKIIAIYLNEPDAHKLIREFEQADYMELGLCANLKKEIPEGATAGEVELGYDFIGVEGDGGFHSFHCHPVVNELEAQLSVRLNENGLFSEVPDWQRAHDYLNNEANGLEPVPWFVAKTKWAG